MLEKVLRFTVIGLFSVVGFVIFANYLTPLIMPLIDLEFLHIGVFGFTILNLLSMLGGGILFGLIGYILAPIGIARIIYYTETSTAVLAKVPTVDILLASMGMFIGLLLANLIGEPVSRVPIVGRYLPLFVSIILGITGLKVALRKKNDLLEILPALLPKGGFKDKLIQSLGISKASNPKELCAQGFCMYKILDTSVIIDGRIADICKTGFVEGIIVVPKFVLEELQKIADSSDALKRNRGRRGLDILNEMQKDKVFQIHIEDTDFEELTEVDAKLVKLAQIMGGAVVTNDFNLNKVAELQGVRVLNINLLANMVKPLVLPGEEMRVHVSKEGKEPGQGIAYLEDGTMIVIEGARRFLGEDLIVIVTTALQTAAGRMIFAKLK